MNRILIVTALWLDKIRGDNYGHNVPVAWIKGKYFYIWHDDHIVKHRFLGYCVNQFAVKIATLKEDNWIK